MNHSIISSLKSFHNLNNCPCSRHRYYVSARPSRHKVAIVSYTAFIFFFWLRITPLMLVHSTQNIARYDKPNRAHRFPQRSAFSTFRLSNLVRIRLSHLLDHWMVEKLATPTKPVLDPDDQSIQHTPSLATVAILHSCIPTTDGPPSHSPESHVSWLGPTPR